MTLNLETPPPAEVRPRMLWANCDQVGRAVREAIDGGTFELVRAVDRMAHLRRVR